MVPCFPWTKTLSSGFISKGSRGDLLASMTGDLHECFWKGTLAMMGNDGSDTNKNVFWKTFKQYMKGDYEKMKMSFWIII